MVRINDAWPGQSTKEMRIFLRLLTFGFVQFSGTSRVNAENCKSNVIPRSTDCGDLSRAAVDSTVDRLPHSEVLPLSMWPSTPILSTVNLSLLPVLSMDCGVFIFDVFSITRITRTDHIFKQRASFIRKKVLYTSELHAVQTHRVGLHSCASTMRLLG